MDLETASRKIFVGGLSYSTDEDKLRGYFEAFGPVQDSVVMKDPLTKRSRGFGFITFEDPLYVDIALEQDVHIIDSRRVEAKRAVPRSEFSSGGKDVPSPATPAAVKTPAPVVLAPAAINPSPAAANGSASDSKYNSEEYAYHKIFVGGLHYETRDGPFRGYFERYGRVLSAEVMFNRETHKSRGFGFIIFELESSVDRVCEEKDHIIDGKMVEVKRAVPRTKLPPSVSAGNASSAAKAQSASASSSKAIPPVASAPSAKPAEAQEVKKSIPSAAKVPASYSISSIGVKSKVTQPKVAGSYAAVLKSNVVEPEVSVGALESEYPPLPPPRTPPSSSKATPDGLTSDSGNVHESSLSPPLSSSHLSPIQQKMQPIGSPSHATYVPTPISPNTGHLERLGSSSLAQSYPPKMMLPQSMMPQQGPSFHQMQQAQMMQHYNQMHPGSASHMQHHMQMQGQAMSHHQSLGQPPFAGMNGMEFDSFGVPLNRSARALSESFLPPKFPSQVHGGGGYYGMPPPQMPQPTQMHMSSSPHMGGSSPGMSGSYSSQLPLSRSDGYSFGSHPDSSFGGLYGGAPYGQHISRTASAPAPNQQFDHSNFILPSSGSDLMKTWSVDAALRAGNIPTGIRGDSDLSNSGVGGLGWLPASLSGASNRSESSELDTNGDDAIGIALRMDLSSMEQSGYGSSRLVTEEFERTRNRGLSLDNNSYIYGGSTTPETHWSPSGPRQSGIGQISPSLSGSNNFRPSVEPSDPIGSSQQEWYPQIQDLSVSAAEFKPTSSRQPSQQGR